MRETENDTRRTEIVPEPRQDSGTHPDIHHVYIDVRHGSWGDRSDLVIVALTDSELSELAAMSDTGRVNTWRAGNRYFGETYGDAIRRHLSIKDRPET